MEGMLSKVEFKKEYKYSESTYQRRMKEFKGNLDYPDGYYSPTRNEVYINQKVYDQFLKDKSNRRLHYEVI